MALLATSLLALTLAVVPSTLAQFVPPPTDLKTTQGFLNLPVRWKEVPYGTCELTPGVKSYSGYVDIEEQQHIFFWFFEARSINPKDAELTVWINGGPGSSSMIGLFEELGPCRVDKKGKVYNNPYAWNNVTNMLFIDHPAQVGFSYSVPVPGYVSSAGDIVQLPDLTCPSYASDCGTYSYPNASDTANSTHAAAPSMWKTLQGFMGAFPQYSRNGFNFATESYGGHYGPIFNQYLEAQNAKIQKGQLKGAKHINLQSLLIGNGWYDPLVQYASYYNYTVFPGNTYDYKPFNKSIQDQMYNAMYGPGNCYDQTVDCNTRKINSICSAADNFCAEEVENVFDVFAGRDEYDMRELSPDPFPPRYYQSLYLNSPALQKAIGAVTNFSDASGNTVYSAFVSTGDDDREVGTVEAVRQLVQQGVYVVQYVGDADYNCNWLGGEVVAQHVHAAGFASAGYQNITTSDAIVHGQVKQSANFAFARIYESGHEVPFYQPLVSLEMLDRVIHGKDVATGRQRIGKGHGYGYRTKGPARSTYREGIATVQFKVLPDDATYNTTTNKPNPTKGNGGGGGKGVKKRRAFKPSYRREGDADGTSSSSHGFRLQPRQG